VLSILLSFAGAGAVGAAGRALGWLTTDGAVAATFIGGTVFAFLGWQGAAILVLFFVTSSLLSHLSWERSGSDRVQRRGRARRNARQVLANGLAAGFAAVWAALAVDSLAERGGFAGVLGLDIAGEGGKALLPRLAFAGTIAAATADTWASEIGRLARGIPRSPLTGRAMQPGESGGVTVLGTFGGLVGAAAIGQVAACLWGDFGVREAVSIEVAGFAGMWIDSLLGAGVQYKAVCPACGRVIEEPDHAHRVERARGLRFVDNDVVNLAATLAGGVLAILAARP